VRFWETGTFVPRLTFRYPPWGSSWGSPFKAWGGTFCLRGNLLPWRTALLDLRAAWEYLHSLRPTAQRSAVPSVPCKRIDLAKPGYSNILGVATDGRTVAWATHPWGGGGKSQVHVRDLAEATHKTFDIPEAIQHYGGLTLSPDGRTLAAPAEAKAVLLIDLPTRERVGRLIHTARITRILFSTDGRLLATTAGKSVWLWDVTDRRPIRRFPAFQKNVESIAFHPDGSLLGAGGGEGEVRLWRRADCRQVACLDWKIGAVNGLAFSPDGMTVAAAGHNGTLVVWDLE
jgi:WD40 repeat protein